MRALSRNNSMAEVRLNTLMRQFNIGLDTLAAFLKEGGFLKGPCTPNDKVPDTCLPFVIQRFGGDRVQLQQTENVRTCLRNKWRDGKHILDQFDQYRQEEKNIPKPNSKKKAQKKAIHAMRITGKGSYFSVTESPFFSCARCGTVISSGYYFAGGIRLCATCRNVLLDKRAIKRSVWSTSGGIPGTGKNR